MDHQKRLGCDGMIDPKLVYTPQHDMKGRPKVIYKKCIGNFFSRTSMGLIKYYTRYKDGELPYDGSYNEQPNKFVELMELIDNLIEENNKDNEKKLNRSQGRYGR